MHYIYIYKICRLHIIVLTVFFTTSMLCVNYKKKKHWNPKIQLLLHFFPPSDITALQFTLENRWWPEGRMDRNFKEHYVHPQGTRNPPPPPILNSLLLLTSEPNFSRLPILVMHLHRYDDWINELMNICVITLKLTDYKLCLHLLVSESPRHS